MLFQSTAATFLALAAGISRVAGQFCSQNINLFTTHGGLQFYIGDDSDGSNDWIPLQLKASPDGTFLYLAIDHSGNSPNLTANLDNGVLYVQDVNSTGGYYSTGQSGFLANYTDYQYTVNNYVGQLAFANDTAYPNATDNAWSLMGSGGTNTYQLWHGEPSDTLNGFQICQANFNLNADGEPWFYFQYVDWINYYPEECEFVGLLVNVAAEDMPPCPDS